MKGELATSVGAGSAVPETMGLQRRRSGENSLLAQGQPGAKAGGERFPDLRGKRAHLPASRGSACLLGKRHVPLQELPALTLHRSPQPTPKLTTVTQHSNNIQTNRKM